MNQLTLEEKHREFEKAVAKIEAKYNMYFSGRKSTYGNRPDCINDHLMTRHETGLSSVNWKADTDLSPDIRKEVENTFKAIYQVPYV
jgi:hypothetical protein